MVQVWFMDHIEADPTSDHHKSPPEFIDLQELFDSTGVEYFHIKLDDRSKLDIIKSDRGYTYEDEITCSERCLPNFEEKLKMFFQEHLHADEEIRHVLDGSGYFDVRNADDNWIRIHVECGDFIIIPSGIYHRFALDPKRYIKAKRYFVGEPVWLPYNRPADNMECRQTYLTKLQNKQFIKKTY